KDSKLLLLPNLLDPIPGLTPDMPGVVLALAFRTRQTQGGGEVQGLRSAARLEYAGKVPAKHDTRRRQDRHARTGRSGRDDDAGTALRRGERGWPIRRPCGARA